jgi:hypothetical protein
VPITLSTVPQPQERLPLDDVPPPTRTKYDRPKVAISAEMNSLDE